MSARPFDAWVLPPDLRTGGGSLRTYAARGESSRDDHVPTLRAPEPTAGLIEQVVARLRAGRNALSQRNWSSVAESIGRVAERFLDPSDPLREAALSALGQTTSLSGEMTRVVLDGMAQDWRAHRLKAMVEAEGLASALDDLTPGPEGMLLRARGWPLTLHFGAGTVPGVSATSLIRALLVKSAVWIKPGLGDVALPVYLARALAEQDEGLADAIAVTYWPGVETPSALVEAVDLVVVYGGNESVRTIRAALPATTPLVAYHHRLSFGVVAREALADPEVAGAVARAAAIFDQRGCVSPHLVFVERGGAIGPGRWAAHLARSCADVAKALPPGPLSPAEASNIHQLRGATALRATVAEGVQVTGADDLAWTVAVDPEAGPAAPCLGRTLVVRPVDDIDTVPAIMSEARAILQSVGWAGPADRGARLAEALSAIGVTRVCSFADQPFPPAWWRHDGRPPLAPLVRWTELAPGSKGG